MRQLHRVPVGAVVGVGSSLSFLRGIVCKPTPCSLRCVGVAVIKSLPKQSRQRACVHTLLCVRLARSDAAEASEPAKGDEGATETAKEDEGGTETAKGDEDATESAEDATETAEGAAETADPVQEEDASKGEDSKGEDASSKKDKEDEDEDENRDKHASERQPDKRKREEGEGNEAKRPAVNRDEVRILLHSKHARSS